MSLRYAVDAMERVSQSASPRSRWYKAGSYSSSCYVKFVSYFQQPDRSAASTYSTNGSNLDTLHNVCIHLLTAILVKFGLARRNLPVVYLTQQWHHIGVQHRGE